MAAYDKMSTTERQQLMQVLASLSGLQEGPEEEFPDGTHYEYDPALKTTAEVTPSGERFPVALVGGKAPTPIRQGPGAQNNTIRTNYSERNEASTRCDSRPHRGG
jgi:hypothetical protein